MIKVASCTLTQLFSGEPIECSHDKKITGVLTIPEYQRPYRWNEEQIIRVLNDLESFNTDQLQKGAKQQLPYYLGSIILHQSEGIQALNIIDGQQRITTLALIAFIQGEFTGLVLKYKSPESQQQIKHNLAWLKQCNNNNKLDAVDLDNITVTLVVTGTEDRAYNFFETQNSGGVRLEGADIIKAHHLRGINTTELQNQYAIEWEKQGDLTKVLDLLMRGRFWQKLNSKPVPKHNQKDEIKTSIVKEFGEDTVKSEQDIGYGRITQEYHHQRVLNSCAVLDGYDLRQPLNTGVNTINYLKYFKSLWAGYLAENKSPESNFSQFYHGFIIELKGCGYLKQLYDACLLLYISTFGEQSLDIAAQKLFRVVYARRVENQKTVKESSIPNFIDKHPVLDWIATCYTPEQLFHYLDTFKLTVNESGLGQADNTVKANFVDKVISKFALELNRKECENREMFAKQFGERFSDQVCRLGGNNDAH